MKTIFFLILFLLLLPITYGLDGTATCLNSSFIQTMVKWQECGATCSNYNITQVYNCTTGCDQSINQCKYLKKTDSGYVAVAIVSVFLTAMLFLLGIKINPGNDFSIFKNGLQTFFFICGLWFLLLDAGMIQSIGAESGMSINTMRLLEDNLENFSRIVYVTMFILFLSYIYVVLMLMLPKKRYK